MQRFDRNIRFGAAITGACLFGLVTLAAHAQAVIAGGCATNANVFKIVKDRAITASPSFNVVSQSNVDFTVGGTTPSCAIVTFSAEARTAATETMLVEARLENGTKCQPDFVNFVSNSPRLATRTMTFACRGVSPGRHTIEMFFVSSSGAAVELNSRTLVVEYRR